MRDPASQVVTALFEECYHSFTRYACRSVGSMQSAEEIVQDVLMALFVELRKGKTIDHPKAWCLAVLQRKISKERKRCQAAPLQPLRGIEEFGEVIDAGEPPPEDASSISRLLTHLTEREREVVLLRMESLKYREIAKVLGISKNTVNTLLARGLGKLQALVKPKDRLRSILGPLAEKNKSAHTLQ